MPNFTSRIELYGTPTSKDYEKLHAAMAAEGFSRTIRYEGEEAVYQLPHGEYNRTSDLTAEAVRDSAKVAASSVWESYAVLVTKAEGGRPAYNLKKT